MKTFLSVFIALICVFTQVYSQSEQEKLDLPGDNLNLYATLKLFQESETLEGFEKALNDENSRVNNLDLNGDDNTDYIEVSDNVEEGVHYIALKIAVSEEEVQDVAVFIVRKSDNGTVEIQLIGDEDLYGKDYIIEPGNDGGETPNPGYVPANNQARVRESIATYQVSAWPVVQYIFVPTYRIWHSPWHWHHYPSYWHAWRPSYWHYYYGYHYNFYDYYRGHFRRSVQYRVPTWRQHYYGGGIRSSSVIVINRNRRGDYKRTYSKPGLAKDGFRVSKKDHPNVSGSRTRLPSFDKSGRPVISRPTITRPVTSRPAVRPEVTGPGGGTTSPTRPATRPATGNSNARPVTKPAVTRPAIRRPATSRPAVAKPGNSTRPVTTRPATRKPSGRENTPR